MSTQVCTIHQPQSKIFSLFDQLMILKSGHILYHGQAAHAMEVWSEAGLPLPENTNPAEHLLDTITPDLDADKDAAHQKLQALAVNVKRLSDLYYHSTDDKVAIS